MRVYVYVDGFNLYYRALRRSPHKWLNLASLAQSLLDPADSVECIRYFTARVKPRSPTCTAPRDQQLYLKALGTLPKVTCHYGRFLAKTKNRPLVICPSIYVDVHDTEEKGSDVNLASHLLNDGWHDRYDAALVLSQDSDLIEPMKMVRAELGKLVGLVWLDGTQPSRYLRAASSFVRHATPARLAAAQFASPLMGNNGHHIVKPADW